METLSILFTSRVRAGILRVLFGVKTQPAHLRDIHRQTGLSIRTVSRDIEQLVKLDLVRRTRDGNRVYFAANDRHPLYPDIRSLVLKTSGLADVLKSALSVKGVRFAFVFGSVAQGKETAGSDVDLMVIGDTGLRKVTAALSGAADSIGREINPHVLTPAEFSQRVKAREHFVSSVMASPKIWIIGSDDELTAMGR